MAKSWRLGAWVELAGVLGYGGGSKVVLREGFERPAGESGWMVDVSKGNTVQVNDGWLEIRAAEKTYAHIQRPLGRDWVRATSAIKAGSGISWCTSVFLYWGPGDWCQMGVIPRGGGRCFVCVTAGGRRSEHDLSACRLDQWQWVGIELGEDGVRFLSSTDGREWRTELVVARPASLKGAAAMLVVGKGFGVDATTPDLNGDYGDRGAVVTIDALGCQKEIARRSKAKRLGSYLRGHWSVENNLPWQLDVSFREVERRIPQGHGAENFSRLCRMALNMPTNEKSQETGIAIKRQDCGWDNDYLLKVLLAQESIKHNCPACARPTVTHRWSAFPVSDGAPLRRRLMGACLSG